jgi:hypothetical protein
VSENVYGPSVLVQGCMDQELLTRCSKMFASIALALSVIFRTTGMVSVSLSSTSINPYIKSFIGVDQLFGELEHKQNTNEQNHIIG